MKISKKHLLWDIVLIVFILLLCLALYLIPSDKGQTAEIRLDGKLYAAYSLNVDRQIEITKDGKMLGLAVIQEGSVRMENAECSGKDCVKNGSISKTGQCILCLPQGIGIYITGDGGLDGVTG